MGLQFDVKAERCHQYRSAILIVAVRDDQGDDEAQTELEMPAADTDRHAERAGDCSALR